MFIYVYYVTVEKLEYSRLRHCFIYYDSWYHSIVYVIKFNYNTPHILKKTKQKKHLIPSQSSSKHVCSTGWLCYSLLMRRSNRNFNTPAPPTSWANLGHLIIFCSRGVGNLAGKTFPMVGNSTFVWVGWGKLNRKSQVSNDLFFRASKSLTVINTCLDEMEEFKGRDIAIS